MKWSELMQGRCYLFHAYLDCILRRFGNQCWDGAFLAFIQEKKIEKEDEVENVLDSIFCKRENTYESNNECTNPFLILLFHTNNCPEDGVLQWMEEPAVSASISGYASILLRKIKRKYLTSHAISFVKLVLLKCRLEGLLFFYVLSCPSLIFLLSRRVTSLIVHWQSMYMSLHIFKNKFVNVLTHLRHAHPNITWASKKTSGIFAAFVLLMWGWEAARIWT